VRAGAAALVVIFASGLLTQLAGVFDDANPQIGAEALPIPALLVFLPLAIACTLLAGLARVRLLSKAELVCVLFAALIATPLMGVGFWRYQLSGLSTIVRRSDWTKFEALPEALWPHGKNLLKGVFAGAGAKGSETITLGGARVADGLAILANTDPNAASSVRTRVLLGSETSAPRTGYAAVAVPGRPYLLTALVRASSLGSDAGYFIRVYCDDETIASAEPVTGRAEAKKKPMLPDGSERVGFYPLSLPNGAQHSVVFEFGLHGKGQAIFRDPRLYDVRAIEAAYKGFKRVTAKEFETLPIAQRQGVIVVPDRLWTAQGLHYLLGLDYPLGDWIAPISRLAVFVLLVFGATFGLTLIFRKQWLQNERYPLPTGRVISVLLGAEPAEGGLGERFFRNRWMWIGFGMSFPWCAFKVLYGYIPSLPDLGINISVKSYLADAFWGHTWEGVEFKVLALFLGLGLLMELNVLLSLVVGYLLYRMQYWFGQAQGYSTDTDFPYFPQQMTGAYLVYTLLVVVFTRRYLVQALRAALGLTQRVPESAIQRAGLLLLAASLVGFPLWAAWLGIGLAGVTLIALHVVMLAFIAAKFRAECGLPTSGFNHPLGSPGNYNVPLEAMVLVPLLGGMTFFGGQSILTMSLLTAVVIPYGFFVVPGLQLEALEIGRRFGVRAPQAALVALLSVCAAFVIGGWIYLISVYGYGAVNLPVADDFNDRLGAFRVFNSQYAASESALSAGASGPVSAVSSSQLTALGFGGSMAALVTILRQLFPGFSFHPIGVLAGASNMMQVVWGSLLVAYLVRLTVLRVGGAATVREKLVPAAIGIFLGALAGHGLHIAGNAYWFFFNMGSVKFRGLL
jgi:hypothetical protein